MTGTQALSPTPSGLEFGPALYRLARAALSQGGVDLGAALSQGGVDVGG